MNMLKNRELADEYAKIIYEMLDMSDREAVVYGLSMIDTAITESLERRLIPFKKSGNNWITKHNSFTIKLNVAYSVGLIEEQFYDKLCTIAKIRNVFAHNPSANSTDQEHVRSQVFSLLSSMSEAIEAAKKSVEEKAIKDMIPLTHDDISNIMDSSFTLKHVISMIYGIIKSDVKYVKTIPRNAYSDSDLYT